MSFVPFQVTGHMIRRAAGKSDLNLYFDSDSASKDDATTYTPSKQFADASVFWSSIINAGSHTAWLQSPQANAWGCATSWGETLPFFFFFAHGVAAGPVLGAWVCGVCGRTCHLVVLVVLVVLRNQSFAL